MIFSFTLYFYSYLRKVTSFAFCYYIKSAQVPPNGRKLPPGPEGWQFGILGEPSRLHCPVPTFQDLPYSRHGAKWQHQGSAMGPVAWEGDELTPVSSG